MSSTGYFRLFGRIGESEGADGADAVSEHHNSDSSPFETLDIVVASLPVTLGRLETGPGRVCIGQNSVVSREHARIDWNGASGEYELEVLSKNSCVVDKKLVGKGQKASLGSRSAVRIGNCRFYFLLPASSRLSLNPQRSYKAPELVAAAFDALTSAEDQPLSVKPVIEWILSNYAECRHDKPQNLYNNVLGTLKRKYAIVETPNADKRILLFKRRPPVNMASAMEIAE